MTNAELDKLKELAERATPGPLYGKFAPNGEPSDPLNWPICRLDLTKGCYPDSPLNGLILTAYTKEDQEYYARVFPNVVLWLIAEVQFLQTFRFLVKENESLRAENEKLKESRTCPACREAMLKPGDAKMLDELRAENDSINGFQTLEDETRSLRSDLNQLNAKLKKCLEMLATAEKLVSENDSLRAENERLKLLVESLNNDYAEACKPHENLDLLRAQLAEAREVLSFYADGWHYRNVGENDITDPGPHDIALETGEKAREYLEKYK